MVNFQGLLEGAHENDEECVPLETWERRNPVSPGCKMCVGCQTEKPFSEFHKSKRRYDGLNVSPIASTSMHLLCFPLIQR